jgi:hypothetical protein
MDADAPDLRLLRSLCDAHEAGLIVDEAHVARWKAHKAQMAGALPAGAYAR